MNITEISMVNVCLNIMTNDQLFELRKFFEDKCVQISQNYISMTHPDSAMGDNLKYNYDLCKGYCNSIDRVLDSRVVPEADLNSLN